MRKISELKRKDKKVATTRKATKTMGARKMAAAGERGGFTIIEVVLVLAIAGLIFLMVFIALPALQRSQRDTQRRENVAALADAVTSYQGNNNGKLPENGQVGSEEEDTAGIALSTYCTGATAAAPSPYPPTHGVATGSGKNSSAACLIKRYLNGIDTSAVGGAAGTADNKFTDPTGHAYGLQIATLASNSTFSPDENDYVDHKAFIIKHAKCDGENAVYSANARDFVVMLRLEGSGVYCSQH